MNNIHPLFAGFIKNNLIESGAALGFEVRTVTALKPFFPLNSESNDAIQAAFKGSPLELGFYRIGDWQAPGVYCVGFAKPLTALALACFLAGRGYEAQTEHRARAIRYRYMGLGDGVYGWFDRREVAEYHGRQHAISKGLAEFSVHALAAPLASSVYTGASVLEDLRVSAYSAVGTAAEGWPQVTTEQTGGFCEAFSLLVDGFMRHTDNIPDFNVQQGATTMHKADPARAVAR